MLWNVIAVFGVITLMATIVFTWMVLKRNEKLARMIRDLSSKNVSMQCQLDTYAENFALSQKMLNSRNEVIASYEKKIQELVEEKRALTARVKDVEDGVAKEFAIPVRQDITIVKADFDKLEMVTLFSGVMKLINNAKAIDDINFYTKLINKIQGLIDQMKDPEESTRS